MLVKLYIHRHDLVCLFDNLVAGGVIIKEMYLSWPERFELIQS